MAALPSLAEKELPRGGAPVLPPKRLGRGLHQDDLYLVGMQFVDGRLQLVPALVEGLGRLSGKGPNIDEDIGVTHSGQT